MPTKRIAFFDIDLTLLNVNSANLWVKRELRLGYLSKWQFAESMFWLMLYHAGKADVRTFLNKAAGWVEGEKEADIRQRTVEFWEEEIKMHVRPKAIEQIEWHRENGDILALLTSSSNYMTPLVAAFVNVEHFLCNHLLAEDGMMLGTMKEPLCFGAGKAIHAKQLAKEMNVNWEESYFYTDSYSDHPFLLEIAHPKVVTPDRRLRRLAQEKKWDILAW